MEVTTFEIEQRKRRRDYIITHIYIVNRMLNCVLKIDKLT